MDYASSSNRQRKKKWFEVNNEVSELRRQLSCLSVPVPTCLTFRSLPDGRTRVYFLSTPTNGWEMTLMYVDILAGENPQFLKWHTLVDSGLTVINGMFSREEQLQWERKRLATWGITSYELHCESGRIVFPASSSIFKCTDSLSNSGPSVVTPVEIHGAPSGAKLDPQICPSNPNLIAYVCNNDIWVTNTATDKTLRLTFVHRGSENLSEDPLSAGTPSYVMQEEFNRFEGFWWEPATANDNGVYRILYEEVDESEVKIYSFPASSNPMLSSVGEVEYLRFPRAGTANAKWAIKIVEFRIENNSDMGDVKILETATPLLQLFPWAEYLVRFGWTPTGEFVWAQLLDRRQRKLELILIRSDQFINVSQISNEDWTLDWLPTIYVLYSQVLDVWINVHDILYFLPNTRKSDAISFIWASEETGWRHLYLINVDLSQQQNGTNLLGDGRTGSHVQHLCNQKITLTSGTWEVSGKSIWVDFTRQLVYFIGLKQTPLEKHLYVVSLRKPGEIRILSAPDHSYNIEFSQDCTLLIALYSNTKTLPACQVYRISHTDWTIDGITLVPIGFLLEPRPVLPLYCPTIYTHQISSGEILFSMVFKPHCFNVGQKYPTVVNIYGGPEVQLVSNTFKGMRQLRMHMLAAQGYCVVAIDSRGSQHRGLAFEGHLKRRMGTVELKDQVEVLHLLANELGYIDMDRLAIHGWSYGGYLSLMALVLHPDLFKIAIAGAPVTSWDLYDTGYTERYMDLPETNRLGYTMGSILNYVKQFPDEQNRLLIIHGLMDENVHFFHTSQLINALIKEGKPYQLQVYPNERHSLRNLDASKHYETMLLTFLNNYL